MKNLKIFALVLTLALIITAAVCTTAFAANEAEAPVIVSKNLSYEDNTHLYYAVKATAGVTAQNTTLNVYADEACAKALAADIAGNLETLEALGGEYIVFRTPGIAAKHITNNVYVQAVTTDGGKSEVVKYSVAEYLYERLYVSERLGKTVTAEQKALYQSYLEYGANAQTVFINQKAESEADKVTLATAYNIVKVIDGAFADGTNQKLVAAGTNATVVATPADASIAQWQVTTIAADGSVSQAKTANTTDAIAINGQTIITAPKVAPPLAFDSANDLAYLQLNTAVGYGSIESTVPQVQQPVSLKVENGQMVLDSPVYHNNIIVFNRTGDATGTKAVFEADVTIDIGNANTSTATGEALWINFIFYDMATGEALTPVRIALADGGVTADTNTQGAPTTALIKDNVKFTLRLEYMINAYGYNTTMVYVKTEGATEWDATLYRSTENAKAPITWDYATQTGTPNAPYADEIGFKIEVNRFEQCTLTLDNVRFDGE